jgi:hypothetical protein
MTGYVDDYNWALVGKVERDAIDDPRCFSSASLRKCMSLEGGILMMGTDKAALSRGDTQSTPLRVQR